MRCHWFVFSSLHACAHLNGHVRTEDASVPQPPQPPQPPQVFFSKRALSFCVSLVDEMMASGQLSPAQRRRGRRLRAMLSMSSSRSPWLWQLHSPVCWSEAEEGGVAAERRPTGTEHRRQSQKGDVYETHEAPRRQTRGGRRCVKTTSA